MPDIDISVVVPIFRCKATLPELHRRLSAVLSGRFGSYEILLVDDGCPEGSWRDISALAAHDENVRGIRLSRNFGQHVAITAGLSEARGRYVAVLDGDLQDPPEVIPRLLEAAQTQRVHLVYARRQSVHQSASRMLAGRLYFHFLRVVSGRRIDPAYGTFTLLSRACVQAYLQLKEPRRHYLFVLYWLGMPSAEVDFDRNRREVGPSSYNLIRLLFHALDGLLFYSWSLARVGLALTALVVLCALAAAMLAAAGHNATVFLAIGLGLLSIMACIGLWVALYVLECSKQRPIFVILERAPCAVDAASEGSP